MTLLEKIKLGKKLEAALLLEHVNVFVSEQDSSINFVTLIEDSHGNPETIFAEVKYLDQVRG